MLCEIEPRQPGWPCWLHFYAHLGHSMKAFPTPVPSFISMPIVLLGLTPTWVSIDDNFASNELGRGEADL